jgi:hypothetical protein
MIGMIRHADSLRDAVARGLPSGTATLRIRSAGPVAGTLAALGPPALATRAALKAHMPVNALKYALAAPCQERVDQPQRSPSVHEPCARLERREANHRTAKTRCPGDPLKAGTRPTTNAPPDIAPRKDDMSVATGSQAKERAHVGCQ